MRPLALKYVNRFKNRTRAIRGDWGWQVKLTILALNEPFMIILNKPVFTI